MFVVWSTFVSGGLWRCITEFSSLINFYEFEGYFSINKTRTQMLGYGTWYSTVSVTFAFAWYLIPEKKVKLGPPWILFEKINSGDLGQNFFEVLLLIVLP